MYGLSPTIVLSLIPAVLGDRLWESYERENFRPQNITGLNHWLYGWRGSYYNGTVTMQMNVVDWTTEDDDDSDKPCAAFLNKTLEISYDAVLAITKTVQDDRNPIMVILTPWQSGINLTSETHTADYPWWDLPFRVLSLPGPPKMGFPIESEPTWNLTTSLASDSAYKLVGAFNHDQEFSSTEGISLKFNHTSCSFNQALYAGAILAPEGNKHLKKLRVQTPQLRGQFDNASASLTIDGFFQVNPPKIRDEGIIAGTISISFLGSVDASRSDDMLKPVNDTPIWDLSLGFKRDLEGKLSAAPRMILSFSTLLCYAIVGLSTCLVFL
ncbi:hypothetical protein AJ78_02966 [Emergomyces pasteurianus Ep9510]|uniref:Uncharacterized protein n=1 Tax=Emergomyces pasteurianus Ep9510 TaxID=1447872 RepID=A0A1J9PKF6_9EURO|nr:hypothetical protein AJ78_02966 [Emergomyces pasteurianus Ep9510]